MRRAVYLKSKVFTNSRAFLLPNTNAHTVQIGKFSQQFSHTLTHSYTNIPLCICADAKQKKIHMKKILPHFSCTQRNVYKPCECAISHAYRATTLVAFCNWKKGGKTKTKTHGRIEITCLKNEERTGKSEWWCYKYVRVCTG